MMGISFRKMGRFCFVGMLVISVNFSLASAADYFVATNGNDGNRGTIQQPFRSIDRAVAALASGDRLFIRGGTYKRWKYRLPVPSGGGSWETATTIAAYNNEKVIITPYDTTTYTGSDILSFNNDLSWIIIDGLILDGLNQSGGKGGGNGIRLSHRGHHFRISNTEIRYTARSAIYTGNATDNEFINLHIHHADHRLPPNNPNYGRRNYGIYMESANNLVKGCDIHHNRGYGINVFSGHDYKPNNNSFIGNVFHENDRSGLLVHAGTGNVLINNVSYGNGTGALSGYTGFNRFGMEVNHGAHNALVYNNTIYGNSSSELFIGGRANKVIARNNILSGTTPGRVALVIQNGSKDSRIENNLIVVGQESDSAGIVAIQEPTARVKGNLIGKPYDPKFKNVQDYNFHLTEKSSARGGGLELEDVTTDFDGVSRTLATGLIGAYGIDIGAFQYVQ